MKSRLFGSGLSSLDAPTGETSPLLRAAVKPDYVVIPVRPKDLADRIDDCIRDLSHQDSFQMKSRVKVFAANASKVCSSTLGFSAGLFGLLSGAALFSMAIVVITNIQVVPVDYNDYLNRYKNTLLDPCGGMINATCGQLFPDSSLGGMFPDSYLYDALRLNGTERSQEYINTLWESCGRSIEAFLDVLSIRKGVDDIACRWKNYMLCASANNMFGKKYLDKVEDESIDTDMKNVAWPMVAIAAEGFLGLGLPILLCLFAVCLYRYQQWHKRTVFALKKDQHDNLMEVAALANISGINIADGDSNVTAIQKLHQFKSSGYVKTTILMENAHDPTFYQHKVDKSVLVFIFGYANLLGEASLKLLENNQPVKVVQEIESGMSRYRGL